jgi:hypothetical protein
MLITGVELSFPSASINFTSSVPAVRELFRDLVCEVNCAKVLGIVYAKTAATAKLATVIDRDLLWIFIYLLSLRVTRM